MTVHSGVAWWGHNPEPGTCMCCQKARPVRRGYNGGAFTGVTYCGTCIVPGHVDCGRPTTAGHPTSGAGPTPTPAPRTPGPAVDLIDQAAGIIATKQREPHTAPYHWAGALWEAGMLRPPGYTAAQGCCQAAVDSEGNAHDVDCRYLAGLAAGRTAAAAALRAEADDEAQRSRRNCCSISIENAYREAARVAENGADHA